MYYHGKVTGSNSNTQLKLCFSFSLNNCTYLMTEFNEMYVSHACTNEAYL